MKLLLIDYEEGKVNIACCFILTGEIEKGIKLFESLTELNAEDLIEIGRALYDVRWYAKSKEYFSQYFTKAVAERSWNPNHCTLDGFCKVLILNNKVEPIHELCNSLSNLAHEFYQFKDNEAMSFQLRFRWSMLAVCCSIREDRMTESIEETRCFIENHKKEAEDEKQICFREVFFLASQWMSQGYYYKALTGYRIVQLVRQELKDIPELFLHDYNNVGVSKEIEICKKNRHDIFVEDKCLNFEP